MCCRPARALLLLACGLIASTNAVALNWLGGGPSLEPKKGPSLRLARPREQHLLGLLSVSLYAAAAHSETLLHTADALQHTPVDALLQARARAILHRAILSASLRRPPPPLRALQAVGLQHAPEVLPAAPPLDALAVAAPSSADAVQVVADAAVAAVTGDAAGAPTTATSPVALLVPPVSAAEMPAPKLPWPLAAYDGALRAHALPTKAATSMTVFAAASALSQRLEGGGEGEVDPLVVARMVCFAGLIDAPLQHTWHNVLEAALPGAAPATVVGKIAADQLTMAPLGLSTFLVAMSLLSGGTLADGTDKVSSELKRIFKVHASFWCVAHTVTFGLVPLEYRVGWAAAVNLVYVTILSMLTQEASKKSAPRGPRIGA